MTAGQRARRSRCICLLAGFAACVSWRALASEQAWPESFRVSLEYTAAPGCPDEAAFKGMIKAELGHDPFREDASDHVVVRMARRGHAVNGSIEWRDSSGKWVGDQVLQPVGSDCSRVAHATAFALALQIQLLEKRRASVPPSTATATDLGARGEESVAPKPDGNATPATSTSTTTATTASNRAAAQGEPARELATSRPSLPEPSPAKPPESTTQGEPPIVAVGAGSSVGFGMSSSAVFLGRVLGSLDWRRVSIELAVEAELPTTTRRSDGAGVKQQRLAASVATCMTLTRWRGCVLGNFGEVRLVGDIDRPSSASVPLAEVGARIGVLQRLWDRSFLVIRADGLTNLSRWTARLDQIPVWTARRFAATLGVDVAVRFR
jgi:hypothetical protein